MFVYAIKFPPAFPFLRSRLFSGRAPATPGCGRPGSPPSDRASLETPTARPALDFAGLSIAKLLFSGPGTYSEDTLDTCFCGAEKYYKSIN